MLSDHLALAKWLIEEKGIDPCEKNSFGETVVSSNVKKPMIS